MEELQKIQSELKAPKNQRNSFGKYNYRSCEDILEAVKPLLAKNKCVLTISDEIKQVGDIVYVESSVALGKVDAVQPYHTVRAQAGIDPNRKGMDIAQSFGSSSSYARKYALNGMFLIDDTKDADATNTHGKEPVKKAANAQEKPKPMSDEQLASISALMIELDLTDDQFKKAMGKPITQVNYTEAEAAIKRLESLKEKKGK